MDYKESKKWLLLLGQKMAGYDLEKITRLADVSGLPLERLRCIHIAGSNGKGSTCAFIAQILQEAGFRVGLYTSPDLVEPTERIKLNGKNIPEKKFTALAEHYKKIIEGRSLEASYFEVSTAMAFRHFLDEKVDFAIIETGMGGRLDATNIITPLVCVITSISLEHTQYLGDTIAKIAAEKAGIIKELVPVVAGQGNMGREEIVKAAAEKGSEVIFAGWAVVESNSGGQKFDLIGPEKIPGLEIKMLGAHQCENAALACAAIISLRRQGFRVPENAMRTGLEKAFWAGRLGVIRKNPMVLLDVAHNPDGWKKIEEALGLFRHKKLIVVFGAMKDKDIAGAKELLSGADRIFLAKPDAQRAQEPAAIAKIVGTGEICPSVPDAIESALACAGKEDLVFVTGSLYVVGEAYRHFGIRP